MNDVEKRMREQGTRNFVADINQDGSTVHPSVGEMYVAKRDGSVEPLRVAHLHEAVTWASQGYADAILVDLIVEETLKNVFNGITTREVEDALVMATVAFVERDPAYGYVAARLLLKKLYRDVTRDHYITDSDSNTAYRASFVKSIGNGLEFGLLDKRMGEFDLERLASEIDPERDKLFDYMGVKTLYERYFTKYEGKHLELPQHFWMRVAMGVSLLEENKNERALEFYHLMSTLRYVPSTPTLLHSGLTRAQLSSCFLSTVEDDLTHIFKCFGDNAQLSKWSGGVANDWTNVRATGAQINSIKVESQGVVPFLKIASDITAAINRSGKRRSASCVYLEAWHLEIEDFLDLRRNTGDERRRTHDINTANWIPDLFIKRVMNGGQWTLFSPEEVSDLHDLYGSAFEKAYCAYEEDARMGKVAKFKTIEATKLWRKMLSRLFETGHPWLTFKDPSNVRSPQDHAGVIHSSNLCTEITLNTSAEETAVCNLGSVNLSRHVREGQLDKAYLGTTIRIAMRMLDNVIDINFYPTKEAGVANMRHRPVGLGVMGFQDALYKLDIPFSAEKALAFADETMELISYHAILSSSELAQERGAYQSYKGSKWDRGLFPYDTIELLEKERGMAIDVNRERKLDWAPVYDHVKAHGMRNSNCMAIAPTATISNIAGSFPCIEPIYKNIYVKANMSGEFTIVNKYLIADLKKLGLWDRDMLDQLKYYDGSVQMMDNVPQHLKDKYKEVFEIDPEWLIKLTAARGKWIDQSQSHNVFMKGVSGKKLSDIYIAAWKAGLKTTYYLRTLGASQIEKSTLDAKKFGYTQKREYTKVESQEAQVPAQPQATVDDLEQALAKPRECSISSDPECDVCQ